MNGNDPEAGSGPASDEDISAWLDGQLDSDGMVRMEQQAASDAGIALKAERMRHLDGLVRTAIPLEEELPEGMLERLGLAQPAGAEIVDLAAVRARKSAALVPAPARSTPWFARVAAGLALAAAIGIGIAPKLNQYREAGQPSAEYTALGDAARLGQASRPAANAIVMFASGVPVQRVRAIVGAEGATLVAGPSPTGTWQLAIAPSRRTAVLAGLRRQREVTLAEPLDGERP